MKYQKSVNEFRNESRHEIERNKPMVRLDTQKCQACIFHVSQKLQNAEMPIQWRMGKCQKLKMPETENAEMPETENA